MSERLVAVRASDGLSLSGVEMVPDQGALTFVVWMHGFGVSYDLPQTVRLGRLLASEGVGFLAGNLRGHAGGVTGWRSGDGPTALVRIGSWWEVFEESALDVGAWVGEACAQGARQIVLAGHSFGALRSVYYLSQCPESPVDGVVLASPSLGLRHLDAAVAERAARLVGAGRGEDLLPPGSWARGFGTDTVSAQTYASWWRVAPGLLTDSPTRFAGIRCPLLVYFGDRGDVGGADDLEWIAAQATGAPEVATCVLSGLSHAYLGGEPLVAQTITGWLRSNNWLVSGAGAPGGMS